MTATVTATPTTMTSLVWTGPRKMELQEQAVPAPTTGELLIQVGAAGICGSELSGYLGQNSLRVPPLVMGHEAAGVIVGPAGLPLADGSSAQPGQSITFNPLVTCGECSHCRAGRTNLCGKRQLIGAHRPGAFAPYVAVPAKQCHPLPPGMSPATGALAEPLAFCLRTVSKLEPGTASLLVIGAGTIGLMCLAAARRAGIATVLVSETSVARLEIAERWGAARKIRADQKNAAEAVRAEFPEGVDGVIDAVGSHQTREQAIRAVRAGGTVVFAGLHSEESPLAANYLIRQEITLHGSFAYTDANFSEALRLLGEGLLPPEAEWMQLRPLNEGGAAFDELTSGNCPYPKIVLQIG